MRYTSSIWAWGLGCAISFGFVGAALAQEVVHNQENSKAPYASSVVVPPGYTTYYISGSPGRSGDTGAQTAATLANLKAQLAKLGLTFGDVVQAHVFLMGDPAKEGKMDFPAMNAEWFKEFGTSTQPNKPARSAFQIAGIAGANTLVEIEFIAVKKVN